MGKFIIEGGHRLSGRVKVQGAKNAALPVLAATVMSRGEMTLFNCPEIRDVHNMLSILRELGVESYYDGDALKISGRNARSSPMPQRLSKELRSSIFMLGPLLSRFGEAVCAYPGGCEIGHRPVDLHLKGLAALGADIREERGYIICGGHNMHGGEIHLDYPSVGATENIMMAAAAVPGDTVIDPVFKVVAVAALVVQPGQTDAVFQTLLIVGAAPALIVFAAAPEFRRAVFGEVVGQALPHQTQLQAIAADQPAVTIHGMEMGAELHGTASFRVVAPV